MSREDAEALVAEHGTNDGQFLVREREGREGKDEYVLCVVYKGKPTHHLIAKDANGMFAINKKV